jgi:hypothetical protein
MRKFFSKINNKKAIVSIVLFFCVFGVLGVADSCSADWIDMVLNPLDTIFVGLMSGITQVAIWVCGAIISIVIWAVIHISHYNNFINEPSIIDAWVIIRDLCNMFFILVLLVIAFATILRMENYSWKKLLPKLLIMAVLINFSKTICGLIIDFSQVIMLTFINAIGDAGGNYINHLGVQKYLKMATSDIWKGEVKLISTLGGMITAIMFLIIAAVVMITLLAVLTMRIVMLWIYIILSPLAFLLSAFPGGQKYASQWWSDFIKQVVTGPVLAFFIWLSLISANTITSIGQGGVGGNKCFGPTEILCPQDFIMFVVAIGMLIGGLIVTQQLGGMAGAAAGRGMAAIGTIRKGAWGVTKAGTDWADRKQALKTGFDLNPFRQAARIKAGLGRGKTKDLSGMELKAGEQLRKGGMTGAVRGFTAMGWADHHVRGFLGYKGIRSALRGGEKKVERLREEENEARWRSRHVFTSQGEFDQKKQEYLQKAQEAKEYGNLSEHKKKMEDVEKMRDLGDELIVEEGKGQKEKELFLKEAEKKAKGAAEYTVIDYEGIKARRVAENEEASKITSSNEDELVAQFDSALAHNNVPLAGALARRIAQVGGFNALLNKFGYQATAGLNEAEVKKLKDAGRESEITEKRGVNDFMRDVFEKRLGMDRQNTLALQSDIGGIGQEINHEYLIKTVGVDKTGKFYQSDQDSRTLNINIEKSKMEREGVIRKGNRLNYGAEDKTTGKFKWSASGLTEFVNNWRLIGKEIKNARLNRSTAAKITEPEALKTLEKVMKKAEDQKVLGEGFEDTKTVDEFIEKLKTYAKSSGEEGVKKIGKVIKDELKEGDQDRTN